MLLVGLVFIYVAFRNIALHDLLDALKRANYWLLIPVFAVTVTGYAARVKRWQLLFRSIGYESRFSNLFIGICVGYLVSYVIPRMGEITRCVIVKRYERIPFNKSLATVIIERLADILTLLLLVGASFVLNISDTAAFFKQNVIGPLWEKASAQVHLLIAAAVLGIIAYAAYLKLGNRSKVKNITTEFIASFKQLLLLKEKGAFIFYTAVIWMAYFLMTYLWVFAFDESCSLNLLQIFIIMVVGSMGKSIPIQGGGMGAYHFLVAQAFLLFGVGLITGSALAVIIHGAQTLFTFLTGSGAYYIMWQREKKRSL